MRLSAENMVIDDFTLPADAGAVGKSLAELSLPKSAHIMAIISGGEVIVPKGDTVLSAGDELLILAEEGEEERIRATFTSRG